MGCCQSQPKPQIPPTDGAGDNQDTNNTNQQTASFNAANDQVDLNSPSNFTENGGVSSPADVSLQVQEG